MWTPHAAVCTIPSKTWSDPMIDLTDMTALVCGASHGIGRACAAVMARCGAEVIVAARGETSLTDVCDNLCRDGGQDHRMLIADFDDLDTLGEKAAALISEAGPIEILVNNSGGPPAGSILDADPAEFTSAYNRHVLANHLLAQLVVPGMKKAGYGRIINIISTSVVTPIPGLGVSNTTRGAVANWGRTLAAELAPFGITVNNVLPGFTDTARLKSLLVKKAEKAGVPADQFAKDVAASIPPRRFARPEEVGNVVAFLASPAASYVNGVNLPVDGGRLATQ